MNRRKTFLFIFAMFAPIVLSIVAVGCAGDKVEASALNPKESVGMDEIPLRAQVGERLKFSIRWLGMQVGTGEVRVEGIETIKGREVYHITLRVKSNKVIDLVYRVRDEHHSYVDVEHFHSLRYEKILREGRYRADEVMEYDQEAHEAIYESRRSGDKKAMLIPEHVQDQLSAAFWLRTQAMTPGESIFVPVNADEKNWKLEVRVLRSERLKTDLGTFDALEIEPSARFHGVFVRRGRFRGWMSMDDKRLPLLMKTKVPVLGSIKIVLVEYEGWEA